MGQMYTRYRYIFGRLFTVIMMVGILSNAATYEMASTIARPIIIEQAA